jgi:glycosyltransferase involved in cell wall biosynthesis
LAACEHSQPAARQPPAREPIGVVGLECCARGPRVTVEAPIVSAVIPTYNAGKYLPDAVRSVLDQTLGEWELLIIDDGSTDGTTNIVAPFLADSRVQYIRTANAGVSTARNHGVSRARGRYVAFLDADDAWEPQNLQTTSAFLDQDAEVDWVYSDGFFADERLVRADIQVAADGDLVEKTLRWQGHVIPALPSNLMVRRQCFENGLCWDPELSTAADQDLTLQLARRYRCHHVRQPLFTYRVRADSMSRNASATERDHIRVFQKAFRDGGPAGWKFRRQCFANLYLIIAGTWWVNGRNRIRAFYFMAKAVLVYPPAAARLVRKLASWI